jgi:hypothetical protein
MRGLLRRSLSLSLSLILASSPVAGAEEDHFVPKQIDAFVAKLQNTPYVFHLTAEEFEKAWAETGVKPAFAAQFEKARMATQGPETSEEKDAWLKTQSSIRDEAAQIVRNLFSQPIEHVNLSMIAILHAYLFEENARAPLSFIINEITNYKFSPAELKRLRKKDTWQAQASKGAIVGTLATMAATAAVLWRKRFSPELLKAMFKSAPKAVAKEAAVVGKEVGEGRGRVRVDDVLSNPFRYVPGSPGTATKELAIDSAKFVSRKRLFSKVTGFLMSPANFKATLSVIGIQVGAGAANVGWNALAKTLFDEDLSTTPINVEDVRSNYYDGLAALRLSCQAHELITYTSQPNFELLEATKFLNGLYSEFSMLKKINPKLLEITDLPPEITLNSGTGAIEFLVTVNGKEIKESFSCPKLKGIKAVPVQVSLTDVLKTLTKTFLSLQEAEQSLKAVAKPQ